MQFRVPLGTALLLALPASLAAQAAEIEFIKDATAGAPAHVGAAAAVARLEPNGTLTGIREGTNGFTCFIMPDGSNAPVCTDASGLAWFKAAFSGAPAPPNTAPGIAYMAKGGMHHETPEGVSVLMPSATTKNVAEPPHWMILWPFSAAGTGLPDRPNPAGMYVMFDGTPYSHLMIYQDPNRVK